MKRILTYLFPLFLALSCGKIQPGAEGLGADEISAELFVSSSELVMEGPATKAQYPLDPAVENTIANLWLLQYASDGRLVKAEYRELDRPVLSISLQVKFVKSPGSTIVLLANMGGVHTDDPQWPSSADFKWGEHQGGSLYDLQHKLLACSMETLDMPHLFMSGITELDISDSEQAVPVNMMLSRLASKFKVAIMSNSDNTYSGVSLQILNAPTRMSFFPNELDLSEYLGDYAAQEVCPQGTFLGTDDYRSFYFYTLENLSSNPQQQTLLRVAATKNGVPTSVTVPVSSHGTTYRNTCYNIQISLK